MKRVGFKLIAMTVCFVIGLAAFSGWSFVGLRLAMDVPPANAEHIAAPIPVVVFERHRIRRVDFMNFTYPNDSPSYSGTTRTIKLTNGEFEFSNPKEHLLWLVDGLVRNIIYADLTGDGEEEAIIDLFSHSGMSGGEHFIFIYTMAGNNTKKLWFFETYGSGSDVGAIREMYAEGEALVLELNGRNRVNGKGSTLNEDYLCDTCYKDFTRVRFQWDGKRFKQKGKIEIHPLPDGQN